MPLECKVLNMGHGLPIVSCDFFVDMSMLLYLSAQMLLTVLSGTGASRPPPMHEASCLIFDVRPHNRGVLHRMLFLHRH